MRDGSYVEYIAHPANVDGSSVANASDIIASVDCLNVAYTGGEFSYYLCDTDHSGAMTASDIIAVIDLLNGAGMHAVWYGTVLPQNNGQCP